MTCGHPEMKDLLNSAEEVSDDCVSWAHFPTATPSLCLEVSGGQNHFLVPSCDPLFPACRGVTGMCGGILALLEDRPNQAHTDFPEPPGVWTTEGCVSHAGQWGERGGSI